MLITDSYVLLAEMSLRNIHCSGEIHRGSDTSPLINLGMSTSQVAVIECSLGCLYIQRETSGSETIIALEIAIGLCEKASG